MQEAAPEGAHAEPDEGTAQRDMPNTQTDEESTPANPPVADSPSVAARNVCRERRSQALNDARASARSGCQHNRDCDAIPGPFGPRPEHQVVVHRRDARALSQTMRSVASDCGYGVTDPSSFDTMDVRCVDRVCEELRTTFHPAEFE